MALELGGMSGEGVHVPSFAAGRALLQVLGVITQSRIGGGGGGRWVPGGHTFFARGFGGPTGGGCAPLFCSTLTAGLQL
jgi:hypothetical protein